MLPSPAPRLPLPFVSGSAALIMEWGILRGNDPFLYGEKLKAYLIAGAKPIASESEYPNRRVDGDDSVWKVACQIKVIEDSIEEIKAQCKELNDK